MNQFSAAPQRDQIYVVDDDEAVRDSLRWLLESAGFMVQLFASAEHFLAQPAPIKFGCILLDVRMQGMSGLELHDELIRRQIQLPLIFITGHADVPMAVSRIKKGAVEFLEKPFNHDELISTVRQALSSARLSLQAVAQGQAANDLLSRLSTRERQVLERIVAGRLNKQIADDLSISIKTVEAHRSNVMEKLEVRTMAELMKVALQSPRASAAS
jgi:two-component system, LuxR family, response regulator TtrR